MDSFLPAGFDKIFEGAKKTMLTDARVRAVIIAYEQALADPKFVAPSYLHAALEGLRRV